MISSAARRWGGVAAWGILAIGVAVHVAQVAGPTWTRAYRYVHGWDFGSYYYAVQAASQGMDPYDTPTLNELVRADRIRGPVPPFFYPPPFLLAMSWTLSMRLTDAYRLWFWLDSLFLLAALLALWRMVPGPVTVAAIGVVLASYTPILENHLVGQANLLVLAVMLWGLHAAERRGWRMQVVGGALMGLACMLKMSPALLVAWWLLRRKWTAVASSCAAAVILSLAVLPLAGPEVQLRFYRDVLPGFGSGDYNGLLLSILYPGNHSLPNLWAQAFDARRILTGSVLVGAGLTNLVLLGLLAWRLRHQTPDRLGVAAAAASVSALMLLVPVYTFDHHLVLVTFPLVVAATALARGRLGVGWEGRAWGLALALAYAALAWSWSAVHRVSGEIGGTGGWLLQEAKCFALLVVLAACAVAAVRPDRRAPTPA